MSPHQSLGFATAIREERLRAAARRPRRADPRRVRAWRRRAAELGLVVAHRLDPSVTPPRPITGAVPSGR